MENGKKPRPVPLPVPRPNYEALVKKACDDYFLSKDEKKLSMDRINAAQRAIKTMTDADPALQKLMQEAMKPDISRAQTIENAMDYSDAVREAFKARCITP